MQGTLSFSCHSRNVVLLSPTRGPWYFMASIPGLLTCVFMSMVEWVPQNIPTIMYSACDKAHGS